MLMNIIYFIVGTQVELAFTPLIITYLLLALLVLIVTSVMFVKMNGKEGFKTVLMLNLNSLINPIVIITNIMPLIIGSVIGHYLF